MKRMAFVTLALSVALGTAFERTELAAQQPVERLFDPVESVEDAAPGSTCHLHEDYIVVERGSTETVGNDLLVRARATRRCDAPRGLLPGVDSLFIAEITTGALRFGERTRCAVRQ